MNDIIELYDIITDKNYKINTKGIKKQCADIGFDYTSIYKLLDGRADNIGYRWILEKDRDKCFILIDFDSRCEYLCISSKSLFIHLNILYNKNEAKYIYELRFGRQRFASIAGKVFHIKNGIKSLNKLTKTKNNSSRLLGIISRVFYKTTIKFRLQHRLINLVNTKKCSKTTELLIGCTSESFLRYFESRFTQGMNWDNYGEWHIDHIIPCSSFNLNNTKEQLTCFNYTNLQPLWATSDIAKNHTDFKFPLGNLNKSDSDIRIDYQMLYSLDTFLKDELSFIYSEDLCILLTQFLVTIGVRKVK